MSMQSHEYRKTIYLCRENIAGWERCIDGYREMAKRISKSEDPNAIPFIAHILNEAIPALENDIKIEHRLLAKIDEHFREQFFVVANNEGESA